MALTFTDVTDPAGAKAIRVDFSDPRTTGADISATNPNLTNNSAFFNIWGNKADGTRVKLADSVQFPPNSNVVFNLQKANYAGFTSVDVAPKLVDASAGTYYWAAAAQLGLNGGSFTALTKSGGGPQTPDTSMTVTVVLQGGGGMGD
jgi:hypothetical protein